jgi:hypothetical protein
VELTPKRRRLLVAGCALAFLLIWFGSLHGEYHSSRYDDGLRYTSTQYFFGIVLWQTKGSDPPGLPLPSPGQGAVLGEARYWRGFGLIIGWSRNHR